VLKNPDGTALEVNGWFEFMPIHPITMSHLWTISFEPADMARLVALRDQGNRDWDRIVDTNEKDLGAHENAWVAFLSGAYATYPQDILNYNISQVNRRVAYMQSDTQDPSTYSESYLQLRNPISTEGLLQLTMGGPQPVYNGGLLMTRVRYYDPESQRPGLPPDVAALVRTLEPARTVLELVNLSQTASREVIVQAGAFNEHLFTTADYEEEVGGNVVGQSANVFSNWFCVHMEPRSHIVLDIGTERFVNQPSYSQPY
jgi:hypothetical protein